MHVKVESFKQARVNGGRNYNTLTAASLCNKKKTSHARLSTSTFHIVSINAGRNTRAHMFRHKILKHIRQTNQLPESSESAHYGDDVADSSPNVAPAEMQSELLTSSSRIVHSRPSPHTCRGTIDVTFLWRPGASSPASLNLAETKNP